MRRHHGHYDRAGTRSRQFGNEIAWTPLRSSLFTSMAIAVLLTVFLGFARTYFLAGICRAPLPAFIIHVHGALFSGWIQLLIATTCLMIAAVARWPFAALQGNIVAATLITYVLLATLAAYDF